MVIGVIHIAGTLPVEVMPVIVVLTVATDVNIDYKLKYINI